MRKAQREQRLNAGLNVDDYDDVDDFDDDDFDDVEAVYVR
jgi:hypothetical protein